MASYSYADPFGTKQQGPVAPLDPLEAEKVKRRQFQRADGRVRSTPGSAQSPLNVVAPDPWKGAEMRFNTSPTRSPGVPSNAAPVGGIPPRNDYANPYYAGPLPSRPAPQPAAPPMRPGTWVTNPDGSADLVGPGRNPDGTMGGGHILDHRPAQPKMPGETPYGISHSASPAPVPPDPNWQVNIVKRFPEIGVAGSPANRAFVESWNKHKDWQRGMADAERVIASLTPKPDAPQLAAPGSATKYADAFTY